MSVSAIPGHTDSSSPTAGDASAPGTAGIASSAPFAFCDACGPEARPTAALDRADHLRGAPAALAALWPHARVLLLDRNGHAPTDAAQQLWTPAGAEIDSAGAPAGAAFLGIDADGRGWFALDGDSAGKTPHTLDLRSAAALWPAREAAAFAQARALQHWRVRHRHCGACGATVAITRAGWAGRCTSCALEHYPRTDPAVIVAVGDGERLLLGRQSGWPARRYSVIAGFVEPGESLEQAVAREVMEETGWHVEPASLKMLGFIHVRHVTPVPEDHPFPHPNFLQVVMRGGDRGASRLGRLRRLGRAVVASVDRGGAVAAAFRDH
ncbi:MAG: NUDIX domain-containing protein, partial [Proteobacteria bacterium]|nr:NUDIX domain-containing protein [Pseudomonadota bacterium]